MLVPGTDRIQASFVGVAKPESTDGEGVADMEIWWKYLLICGDSYW